MRGWRLEYASLFHVAPRDMEDLYPSQIVAMDEAIDDLRRKQRQ